MTTAKTTTTPSADTAYRTYSYRCTDCGTAFDQLYRPGRAPHAICAVNAPCDCDAPVILDTAEAA